MRYDAERRTAIGCRRASHDPFFCTRCRARAVSARLTGGKRLILHCSDHNTNTCCSWLSLLPRRGRILYMISCHFFLGSLLAFHISTHPASSDTSFSSCTHGARLSADKNDSKLRRSPFSQSGHRPCLPVFWNQGSGFNMVKLENVKARKSPIAAPLPLNNFTLRCNRLELGRTTLTGAQLAPCCQITPPVTR
ncbi:unnamed protein product [Periconia digitata]|uniref:Uncharacterized protein n=1 Tax=Periconia digitata TaxID=1303443 RepID=A0A9W4XRN9_9PLEO|nr:unnamed protein product [Periconia digitata]